MEFRINLEVTSNSTLIVVDNFRQLQKLTGQAVFEEAFNLNFRVLL